jgi:adenosine deaminase
MDRHPICICTDDVGIFGQELNQEYALVSTAFQLDTKQLVLLAKSAIGGLFCSQEIIQWISDIFENYLDSLE